jgi:hypothetical protein
MEDAGAVVDSEVREGRLQGETVGKEAGKKMEGRTVMVLVQLVGVGLVPGGVLLAFAGELDGEDDGVGVSWGLACRSDISSEGTRSQLGNFWILFPSLSVECKPLLPISTLDPISHTSSPTLPSILLQHYSKPQRTHQQSSSSHASARCSTGSSPIDERGPHPER